MELKYYKRYCSDIENVENYKIAVKDEFKGWHLHHRLETHNPDGERRLVDITKAELIALNMYWHRPSDELIFLTKNEHNMLHHEGNTYFLGKHHSDESKKKIGQASKERQPMLGKHHSDESKKKIGENSIGRHWYNNGQINKFCYECPDGFTPGRLLINKGN